MASRLKEDEKNERTIRNLLKLPDNRRCINCNSLGPQYVCTNFWTFVCTNCSGIHREFTHRVKSISMAKFTSQEVSALQGGGNASAREIYLKEWDPHKNSLPDGSNVERLRNFIKHVYVDRRYTGEKSFEKPPRGKMGEIEDSNQSGSRSPPYQDTYDRRFSPGGRSPGYEQENKQKSNEILNDWRREDRFGNGRKSEESRISDVRSPDRQSDSDLSMSSPPVVRPVRDILGDNVSPLRIEPPKSSTVSKSPDGSVRTQRTASSSSLTSSNGNPGELKTETSLIDFDDVPEPIAVTVTAVPLPLQQPVIVPVVQQTTPSFVDNWANFDAFTEVKTSQVSSNVNPLESVLSELSFPSTGGSSIDNSSAFPSLVSVFDSLPAVPPPVQPPVPPPVTAIPDPMQLLSGGNSNSFMQPPNGGQWNNTQPNQNTSFPGTSGLTNPQPFFGGPSNNQPWNMLTTTPYSQGPPRGPTPQPPSQVIPTPPTLDTTSGHGGRKELPQDLFATTFSGWNTGPPHNAGYNNMQYNMQMPMPSYPQPTKSTNPFDVGIEQPPVQVQAPTFPSMTSLHGALPNMVQNPNLGAPPSYTSPVFPGSYLGQQGPSNMPLRPQGTPGFGMEGYPPQQMGGLYATPGNHNTFSSGGGNPFG